MIASIMMDEKFTVGFVNFMSKNFPKEEIYYLVISNHKTLRYCEPIRDYSNVYVIDKSVASILRMIRFMKKAKGIILNGLFFKELIYVLNLPKMASKSYWCVYGGDLYSDPFEVGIYKKIKTHVIRKLKGIIVGIPGDYDYAKKKYQTSSKGFYCLGPNTVLDQAVEPMMKKNNERLNIIIGNSADIENRHKWLIDRIKDLIEEDMTVFIPLSYGDKKNAEEIKEYAFANLKCNVNPMMEFIQLDKYNEFLKTIDIAIYGHDRQQAFSNIVQLIANGCAIYMNSKSTIYEWLKKCNITVFDIESLKKKPLIALTRDQKERNNTLIKNYCNYNNLIKQWESVINNIYEIN